MITPNQISFIAHTEMKKAELPPISSMRADQGDSFGTVLKETDTKIKTLPKKADPNRRETGGEGGIVQGDMRGNQSGKAPDASSTKTSDETQKNPEKETDSSPISKRLAQDVEAMDGLIKFFTKRLNAFDRVGAWNAELSQVAQNMTQTSETLNPSLLSPWASPIKIETPMMSWKSLMPIFERSAMDESQVIEQIIQKLSLKQMDLHGKGQMTLELEPKDLGALKIEIAVNKGAVSAEILTQHHGIKDILEKNQSLLMDALLNSGFRVDQFSVNVGDFTNQSHTNEGRQGSSFSEMNKRLSEMPILAGISEALRGRLSEKSAVSLYV